MLVAVIAAAASAALALWVWRDAGDDRPTDSTPSRLFAPGDLPVDEVRRITLGRRDADRLVFERTGSSWRQVEPFNMPMSPYSMRQFILMASELESIGTSSDADDEALSLDPPLGSLTFEWTGGARTLHFGRRGVGGRAYLKVEGDDAAHIVIQRLHERVLDQHPNEWRERRLFEHAGPDSQRVVIDRGDARFVLERTGRRWAMIDPVNARLDQDAIDQFLGSLATVEASMFIIDQPGDIGAFGLTTPAATITVTTPAGASVGSTESSAATERLLIGSSRDQSGDRFAMIEGRPVVMAVPFAALQHALMPEQTIELTASNVDPADVRSITVTPRGAAGFTIERHPDDPTRWLSPDFVGYVVPGEPVASLLEHLTRTRARTWEQREYPFDAEAAAVVFAGFDGSPLTAFRIAREAASGEWLVFSDDPLIRVFPASIALPLDPAAFGIGE